MFKPKPCRIKREWIEWSLPLMRFNPKIVLDACYTYDDPYLFEGELCRNVFCYPRVAGREYHNTMYTEIIPDRFIIK